MRRQRRRYIDHATTRMRYRDTSGQQMKLVLNATRQFPVFLGEVFRIAHDRMFDVRHVRTELMSSSSHRLERKPCKPLRRRIDDGVVGDGMARAFFAMRRNAHD